MTSTFQCRKEILLEGLKLNTTCLVLHSKSIHVWYHCVQIACELMFLKNLGPLHTENRLYKGFRLADHLRPFLLIV